MIRLVTIVFLLLASINGIAQEWRYQKGKKLFTSLNEALINPENVYNLSLGGRELYKKDYTGIKKMKHLYYLALDGGDIEQLPVGLFDSLKELRTLSLTKNKFTRLPDEIRKLKRLEYLVMYDNEIDSVPDWIGELQQLDNLILPRNRIRYLSPHTGTLKKLNYLSLGNNLLMSVPDEIGELPSLEYFDISENKINYIQPSLFKLRKLEMLALSGNPFQSLPENIEKLGSLKNLQLSNTNLKRLPESIQRLNKLKELYIDNNPDLSLDILSALPAGLEILHMSKISPGEFPACIRNCLMLKYIEAEGNHFNTLPEWPGRLSKLKWLILDDNNLSEVPSWICDLVNIEILRFSGNPIDSVPSCLFLLPRLEGLSFYSTRISHIPETIYKARKLKWFNAEDTRLTYDECYKVSRLLPRKTEFSYDSPYYLNTDSVVCYTEKEQFTPWGGYTQQAVDPYFKGGSTLFMSFLNFQLDTTLLNKLCLTKGASWTDSVIVKFYVQRNGGLFNIQFEGNPDLFLKEETRRLLLLTCRYWVPPMTGGFYITGRTQLVFVYNYSIKENKHIQSVYAYNPLPAAPRILNFEED